MEDFRSNPDIDDKPIMPLEEAFEKVKPFIMAYEGIQNEEEWKVRQLFCALFFSSRFMWCHCFLQFVAEGIYIYYTELTQCDLFCGFAVIYVIGLFMPVG